MVAIEQEKKKKKKNKEVQLEELVVEEQNVEVEQDKEKKKKKKKNKEKDVVIEEPEPVVEAVADEPTEKKKKKKKKDEKSESNGVSEEPIMEIEAPAEEQEKKKKKKKDKNNDKTENGSSTPLSHPDYKYQEHPDVAALSETKVTEFRSQHSIVLSGNGCDVKPILEFSQLPIPSKFLSCLSSFKAPTPIQAQTWPVILKGRDVVGIAQTGSGKTLAFTLPCLPYLEERKATAKKLHIGAPFALVLAPTRELALQIFEVCDAAGKTVGLKTLCVYGGADKNEQSQHLKRGIDIVIATPGRLIQFMKDGEITLERVSYIVLDEADRMLDLGFEPDIRRIFGQVAPIDQRQTLMFSATWPKAIQQLAHEFLSDPIQISIGRDDMSQLTANRSVTQYVEVMEEREKDGKLIKLLREYAKTRKERILVFVLYKKDVERVENLIRRNGYSAKGISGDKAQSHRQDALASFKDGTQPILVATDVAARGLDIPQVQYVINYSFPLTVEDYIHRIGRTGRAGNTGISYTFFTRFEKNLAGSLVNVLREAQQEVPPELTKFGCGVKRKEHSMYGAAGQDDISAKKPVRMKFD